MKLQPDSLASWRRPVVWLNILCLDAPIVALSWQWLFGRTFGVVIHPAERAALFLTAWLIYLLDRFADSVSPAVPKSARQEFCFRHKDAWIWLIALGGLLDAALILRWMESETVIRGIVLGGFATVYLAINLFWSRLWQSIPIKELVVGCLFAAGTLISFTSPKSASGLTTILAAGFFAALCALNCVAIAVWERDLDLARGKHSIATRSAGTMDWIHWAPVMLAGGCLLFPLFDPRVWPVALCLALSSILLFGLHFLRVPRDERTALADLVLFTPLVFALGEKLL